jgi:hypothetical protein
LNCPIRISGKRENPTEHLVSFSVISHLLIPFKGKVDTQLPIFVLDGTNPADKRSTNPVLSNQEG